MKSSVGYAIREIVGKFRNARVLIDLCRFVLFAALRCTNKLHEKFPWEWRRRCSACVTNSSVFIFVWCRLKMFLIATLNDGNKTYTLLSVLCLKIDAIFHLFHPVSPCLHLHKCSITIIRRNLSAGFLSTTSRNSAQDMHHLSPLSSVSFGHRIAARLGEMKVNSMKTTRFTDPFIDDG